jgi:hypothetical protein
MNDSKKKTRREIATLNLQFVYATLEPSERNLFKGLLLQHVSPYQVPYLYWASGTIDRRGCWLQLSEHVCVDVADAWRNWASEIAEEDPRDDTVRVLILALLSELVSMVFPEESLPPGTVVWT